MVGQGEHGRQVLANLAVFRQAGGIEEVVVAQVDDHPLAVRLQPAGKGAVLGGVGLGEHHRLVAVGARLVVDLDVPAACGQEGDGRQHAVAIAGDRRIVDSRLERQGHRPLP